MEEVQIKLTEKQSLAWSALTDTKTNEVLFGGGAWWGKVVSWVFVVNNNVPDLSKNKVVDGQGNTQKFERLHAKNLY